MLLHTKFGQSWTRIFRGDIENINLYLLGPSPQICMDITIIALVTKVVHKKFERNWDKTFWQGKRVTCFSNGSCIDLYNFDSSSSEVSKYLNG